LIDRQTLAAVGDYGTFTVPAARLQFRPAGATYLVLVADRAGMVIESNETNNVASLALPPLDATNRPPVVTLPTGEVAVVAGAVVTITGSFADPSSSSWSAKLDQGDGSGPVPLALNADHTFSKAVTYAAAQTYTLTVTVTNNAGLKGSATILVKVAGATTLPAPVPAARLISAVATLRKATFTGLTLKFDKALGKPSGATITLVQAGRDRRFGTRDDVKIALKAPAASGHTLGLLLKKAARLAKVARLTVTGLRAADGQFVDANGDGVPDASWARTLSPNQKGKSISVF
jgi:PKD repeat protein